MYLIAQPNLSLTINSKYLTLTDLIMSESFWEQNYVPPTNSAIGAIELRQFKK